MDTTQWGGGVQQVRGLINRLHLTLRHDALAPARPACNAVQHLLLHQHGTRALRRGAEECIAQHHTLSTPTLSEATKQPVPAAACM